MKVCKDKHPLKVKVDKIFKLMEELEVSFELISSHIYVGDKEHDTHDMSYFLVDSDSGEDLSVLPPPFEYKIWRHEE